MKNIKNLAIFERKILERKQKGFFKEVTEVEFLKNFTPKKKETFLNKINERKKVLFKEAALYNLTTQKGKKQLLIDVINNKNEKNTLFVDVKNNIIKLVF